MYRDGIDVEKDVAQSYAQFLIYNEFKRDFSYIQQQAIIKEIQELEKVVSASDKSNGIENSENILGRRLENIHNLYTAEL